MYATGCRRLLCLQGRDERAPVSKVLARPHTNPAYVGHSRYSNAGPINIA
jgi:hypothetical protein